MITIESEAMCDSACGGRACAKRAHPKSALHVAVDGAFWDDAGELVPAVEAVAREARERGEDPAVALRRLRRPEEGAKRVIATAEEARRAGYTGETCAQCQSLQMRRAGKCAICETCGDSSSCS